MNELIAKLKGRDGGVYKITSGEKIFTVPSFDSVKEYSPSVLLDDDEWYVLDSFSAQSYSPEFIKGNFSSTEYNQIDSKEYRNIDYLCSYQHGKFCFQKVTSSQFVTKKHLSFGGTPKIVEDPNTLAINHEPDAVYVKSTDKLYFKRLPTASGIFKGMDILFREATDKETDKFMKNDFIKQADGYTLVDIKSANRRRITMAREVLKNLKPKKREELIDYVKDYCRNIKWKGEAFLINSEEDLKWVLYGINERFYTTITNRERRVANSVSPMP